MAVQPVRLELPARKESEVVRIRLKDGTIVTRTREQLEPKPKEEPKP